VQTEALNPGGNEEGVRRGAGMRGAYYLSARAGRKVSMLPVQITIWSGKEGKHVWTGKRDSANRDLGDEKRTQFDCIARG